MDKPPGRKLTFVLFLALAPYQTGMGLALLVHCSTVRAESEFVADGVPRLVRTEGMPWKRCPGYVECSGVENYLYAGEALATFLPQAKTLAAIFISERVSPS